MWWALGALCSMVSLLVGLIVGMLLAGLVITEPDDRHRYGEAIYRPSLRR